MKRESARSGLHVGAAFVAVAMALANSRSVRAQPPEAPPPPAIAHLLPGDGALLASFRLPEIEDGFAFADLLAGLYPELTRVVSQVRMALALPSLSETALDARGMRGNEASFASLGRVPAKLPKNTDGLAHRLVVPVSEADAFFAYARQVMERAGFAVFDATNKKTKAPSWARPMATTVKKRRVQLMGFAADTGSGVALSWQGDGAQSSVGFAIIDIFVPASLPAKPKLVQPLFARGLKATLEDTSFAPLRDSWNVGTRSRLASTASLVLVVQPEAIAKTMPPACQSRWQSAEGAYFADAALTARLHPFDWKLRIAFAPTLAAAPLLQQGGANDGLVDARALATAGLAAGILYSPAAALWGQLPRPALLGATWAQTQARWQECGPGAQAISFASHWPHLITSLFAETLEPLGALDWKAMARNLAMSLRTPLLAQAEPSPAASAVWMASFADRSQPDVVRWLAQHAQSAPEKAAFGDRSPNLWSLVGASSLKSAGIESLPGSRFGLALSPLETGLDWYYGQKRRPAVFGNRAALGSVHINVGRILNLAAENADVGTRDAVALATSQLSMLGGDLVVNGQVLELDLSLAGNSGM